MVTLPAHALAEINDKKLSKKQRAAHAAYWDAWAAVGDAKQAEADASRHVIDVEQDWHQCCLEHAVRLPSCGCGQHPALYLAAREARDTARADVTSAIEKFKGP